MASTISPSPTGTTMTPSVELTEAPMMSASVKPTSDSDQQTPDPQQNPARRSRILSPGDNSAKRLSTTSIPARDAPRLDPATASPPAVTALSSSPTPSTSNPMPRTKHQIPSFPPPQASRVSVISISSNCDSFQPQFPSSLSYAQVRDFAYPPIHPLHYGPSLNSAISTPAGSQRESGYMEAGGSNWFTGGGSGFRRLSDPAVSSSETAWGEANLHRQRHANQPPPLNFSDGPPWSEDEDLQSPVVVEKSGTQHRKHKSSVAHVQSHTRGQSKNAFTPTTLQSFPGSRGDKDWGDGTIDDGLDPGSNYYTTRAGRRDLADGEPGGELYNHREEEEYDPDNPNYYHNPDYIYSDDEEREFDEADPDYDSRFSKDYQFTIASPAEEMHGKAVALFDFVQENENELPLSEGQVVWVSYRHGQGWLVAEDPKTGESGLVPEEYVRLLRDMHPPYESQGSEMNPSALMPEAASMDEDPDYAGDPIDRPPVVSTFSTSSADVYPYPHPLKNEGMHPETPTRIEQIRREQERAVEEEGETPRLTSDTFEPKVNGETEDGKKNANREFYDDPESQGIDFRESQRKSLTTTTNTENK